MKKPLLKQAGDLTSRDLREHPVWIGCHTEDSDEPWYEETDEATFRPWSGALPVAPSDGMFLVRAKITFQDGSQHEGYLTPAHDPSDIGTMQPGVFLGEESFFFWGGLFGVPSEERERFYRAAGLAADRVFPMRFAAEAGLAVGEYTGQIEGFYKGCAPRPIEVEQ